MVAQQCFRSLEWLLILITSHCCPGPMIRSDIVMLCTLTKEEKMVINLFSHSENTRDQTDCHSLGVFPTGRQWTGNQIYVFHSSSTLAFSCTQGHGCLLESIPAVMGIRQGAPWTNGQMEIY